MRLLFRPARRDAARPLLLLLLLLALLAPAPLARASAQRQRRDEGARRTSASRAKPARPRLVLLIAVDQFRYDYLERFGDLFAENGIRRLLREGASWSEANYDHVPTETAPGHATMLTGAWPSETGIIANDWYDRAEGKRVNNVGDDAVRALGGGDGEVASSPRNLLCSTLGDELKLATNNRSRVVGVSLKNRAAILPAGRMADAAYWLSSQTGEFVSSTYYFERLPEWVTRFNAARPADKFFGAKWERLLPAAEYERRAGADDAPWERGDGKLSSTFPHVLTGGLAKPGPEFYDALSYSPFTNDVLLDFAEQALTNERLGDDGDTDVLTVSFSANDIVGHRYGPYSQEVMDVTLRVDRQIARLLDFVDARVGLRNTLVAFTADHGVAPSPPHAASLRLPGSYVKVSDVLAAVRNRLRVRFGKTSERDTTVDYIQTFSNGHIYFNRSALERDGVQIEEAERVAGEAALTIPGVARYFTRTQLLNNSVSQGDAVARRVLHGYNARRSGDVVLISEPFRYLADYVAVATHGTPYSYDTHVPLVIMGGGVAPGRYRQPASPADIAPTLASLLGVQSPSSATGRVLTEAFK
ncbi:MAG TPA: alkaline phosphatase family protein [Pyrinomonadaceae bacterium]|jgi:predicted AlkP superfamily pyrophosphatase or phosphodiesterase|nr:alkaline phosphatase family protein [Pyrinomonadaceae bacterium]